MKKIMKQNILIMLSAVFFYGSGIRSWKDREDWLMSSVLLCCLGGFSFWRYTIFCTLCFCALLNPIFDVVLISFFLCSCHHSSMIYWFFFLLWSLYFIISRLHRIFPLTEFYLLKLQTDSVFFQSLSLLYTV